MNEAFSFVYAANMINGFLCVSAHALCVFICKNTVQRERKYTCMRSCPLVYIISAAEADLCARTY